MKNVCKFFCFAWEVWVEVEKIVYIRDQQKCYAKSKTVNSLDFAGHAVSVKTIQICIMAAAIHNT